MVELKVLNIFNSSEEISEKIDFPDELLYFTSPDSLKMAYYIINMDKNFSNAHTKERWAVSGTTKKAYKQKGTGRARHGTLRASQFRGGGVTFGPLNTPRKVKLNKNTRFIATFTALVEHINKGTLVIANDFVMNNVKTKIAFDALKNVKNLLVDQTDVPETYRSRKSMGCLLIGDSNDVLSNNIMLSSRNIVGVKFIYDSYLNVYDLVRTNFLVISKSAFINIVNKFKEKFAI